MIEYQIDKHDSSLDLKQYTLWLKKVIQHESFTEGNITYVFCDDEQLLAINQKYLQHDTYTDIITFPMMENADNIISGEIYISLDRVKENADQFKTTFNQELGRVLVHGILHLCGYDDHTDFEKVQMRSKEDYYLSLLSKI